MGYFLPINSCQPNWSEKGVYSCGLGQTFCVADAHWFSEQKNCTKARVNLASFGDASAELGWERMWWKAIEDFIYIHSPKQKSHSQSSVVKVFMTV